MKDFQTPQKDQSRPSDLSNGRFQETPLKKSQKIPQKNLNAAFKIVSDDSSHPLDFTPISESFSNPSISASSEPLGLSDLSPSSTIAFTKTDVTDLSLNRHQLFKSNGSNIGSVEADVLVNLLKEARSQVVNSADVNLKNKTLLDSLIKFVSEEFYTIPQERDGVVELVSMERRIAFMCFLICILSVLVILFFNSEPQRSLIGPLPT